MESTVTFHGWHLVSWRGGLHASGAFFFHEGLDQTLQHLSFHSIGVAETDTNWRKQKGPNEHVVEFMKSGSHEIDELLS